MREVRQRMVVDRRQVIVFLVLVAVVDFIEEILISRVDVYGQRQGVIIDLVVVKIAIRRATVPIVVP